MIHIQIPVPGLHYYFTDETKNESDLTTAEREAAAGFGAKRRADFATGRYCLRQCTGLLNYKDSVLIGPRGMPLLPPGIVGSISHSPKLCGAIAGAMDQFRSVGLDIESLGRVLPEMWSLLFTEGELDYLNSIAVERQMELATIFFSLKEAFYKLQFPLSGLFLDFPDVEIIAADVGFQVRNRKPVGALFVEGQQTLGYVFRFGEEIITICYLEHGQA
jgi:4'-phosphopantetheinyl transferase EntD